MYVCTYLTLCQYLLPEESFPASLLLFHQFDDRLIGLHFPTASLSNDAGLKLQVNYVDLSIHSATEDNTKSPSIHHESLYCAAHTCTRVLGKNSRFHHKFTQTSVWSLKGIFPINPHYLKRCTPKIANRVNCGSFCDTLSMHVGFKCLRSCSKLY